MRIASDRSGSNLGLRPQPDRGPDHRVPTVNPLRRLGSQKTEGRICPFRFLPFASCHLAFGFDPISLLLRQLQVWVRSVALVGFGWAGLRFGSGFSLSGPLILNDLLRWLLAWDGFALALLLALFRIVC